MTDAGIEQSSPHASGVHTFFGAVHALEFPGHPVDARFLLKPHLAQLLPLP